MSDTPYTEGWPRTYGDGGFPDFDGTAVVPLADAERMRETALYHIRRAASEHEAGGDPSGPIHSAMAVLNRGQAE